MKFEEIKLGQRVYVDPIDCPEHYRNLSQFGEAIIVAIVSSTREMILVFDARIWNHPSSKPHKHFFTEEYLPWDDEWNGHQLRFAEAKNVGGFIFDIIQPLLGIKCHYNILGESVF
jgi:hypothetical protein